MKHIFILNPAAGSGRSYQELMKELRECPEQISVYETKYPGDAVRFIREYCRKEREPVRFYACGGDGTIHEVAEGIVGFEQAEMSCYPCGSGNDFVKYYGGAERFRSLKGLIAADPVPIDLIRVGDRYSINVVNFGFDTCVAKTMIRMKNKKLIGGKRAYSYGVFKAVLTAMRNKAEIYADGELLNPDGKFLLCTAANGKYIGGAFQCAPRSLNDDGFMEVCMVKPVSRFRFIKLLPAYTAGRHLDDPRFQDIIQYRRCRTLEVKAPEGFAISVDGEIMEISRFICETVPGAIRFAVPPDGRIPAEGKKEKAAAV